MKGRKGKGAKKRERRKVKEVGQPNLPHTEQNGVLTPCRQWLAYRVLA